MDSPVESMMTEIHSHTLPYVAGGAETRGWGAEVGEICISEGGVISVDVGDSVL